MIVDLAAETGRQLRADEARREVVENGVTIVGLTNLPSKMASDASRLYARNVQALLNHLAPEGELVARLRRRDHRRRLRDPERRGCMITAV